MSVCFPAIQEGLEAWSAHPSYSLSTRCPAFWTSQAVSQLLLQFIGAMPSQVSPQDRQDMYIVTSVDMMSIEDAGSFSVASSYRSAHDVLRDTIYQINCIEPAAASMCNERTTMHVTKCIYGIIALTNHALRRRNFLTIEHHGCI